MDLRPIADFLVNNAHALLVGTEVVWLVLMTCFILLERRPPASTLAWILGLAVLPIVGYLIYHLAGPRRLKRRKLRRREARVLVSHLHAANAEAWAQASAQQKPMMQLAHRLGAGLPELATDVVLYAEGDPLYDDMVKAIDEAAAHVHAEYYIFNADQAGQRFQRALCEAARRGVKVRLLVDALGTRPWPRSFWKSWRASGVEVMTFNSTALSSVRRRLVNFRTHRKILVCDGKVGFTGGINIADDHSAKVMGAAAWRDTHVRLGGTAVHGLQRTFLEDWLYAAPRRKPSFDAPASFFPFPEGRAHQGSAVQIVASGPDQERYEMEAIYLEAIGRAEKRVWLTTPYFVPPETVTEAMCNAAQRGVDVRLLLPRATDNRLVDAASRTFWEPLLHCGVRLFEYPSRMVHAKTAVIDDAFGIVGTANLDFRSLRLNFEVGAVLYGKDEVEGLAKMFEEDLKHCVRIQISKVEPPLSRRLFESAARVLSPQL